VYRKLGVRSRVLLGGEHQSRHASVRFAFHLASHGQLSTSSSNSGSATLRWGPPTLKGTTLTFNAQPLTSEETIGGPIAATIDARSSNRNLELNGTLFDVSPSGQRTQLATGTVLGSLRATDDSRSWYDKNHLLVRPEYHYATNRYAAANSLQRYDIGLTPTLYAVPAGDHLQFVLTTQPPADKCASLLSALTTPLPCLPSAPQKRTLPGGVYQVVWGASTSSSVNVPLLPEGAVGVTSSGVTPASPAWLSRSIGARDSATKAPSIVLNRIPNGSGSSPDPPMGVLVSASCS
jgi:X-Pro dipeptidyl-peptidase C-terminal non-catalytic domain